MSALTGPEIEAIVVIVVVCAVMAAVGLLLLQRLRRRRDQLRGDLVRRPEVVSDRAFNRISMARREAEVLSGQGVDVPRARELIGQAQASFDAREFDLAYERAQSAHEVLVAARRRPPPPAAPPAPTTLTPSAPGSPPTTPPAPKIPAYRAESQFQLRLLHSEVGGGAKAKAADGRRLRAQSLASQAQQAYDRGDYAEAFRLALKGRRELGSSVESLGPRPAGGTSSPGARPGDVGEAAEALAGADRCPNCGHPMGTPETFCRGCGTPRAAPG